MTHVADDETIGRFVRRLSGLVGRARAGSLNLDTLWDIIQGYLDAKLGNVEGVLRGTHRIVEVEKPAELPLLRFIGTVYVPAIFPAFDVEHIRDGVEVGGVKVVFIDPLFKSDFDGMVEKVQPATIFRCNELLVSGPRGIDEALEGSAEATVGQILWLMAEGKIRKDGKAVFFRVRSRKGNLRLVSVYCGASPFGDGWHIYATNASTGIRRSAGLHVYSRVAKGLQAA